MERMVRRLVGEQHAVFGDLYLELAAGNAGFESWHTDLHSLFPLEDPLDMVSAWISLSSPTERTGGGLYLSAPDPLSLRLAHLSHLRTISPELNQFIQWNADRVDAFLDETGVVHRPRRGECLLFSNALFHRTEPVTVSDFERKCLILRLVKTPLRVNEERLVALERRGTAAAWVTRWRELLSA
jgi:hypothetical protein